MVSFKQIAYQILVGEKKPLHSKVITELALKKGLETNGKTPWATMNAVLITDINSKKEKSQFVKTGSSIFTVNKLFKQVKTIEKVERIKIDEEFVKHSIIKYLSCLGWGNFQYDELHAHGVDIRCKKNGYSRYLSIEVKGQSILKQSSEVAFIYSLGQIITRMKDSGATRNYYGLGLPEESANIALRRLPWETVTKWSLFLTVIPYNSI